MFKFNKLIHSNLQSHLQGLFSSSMTGVRCTNARNSISRLSRPQSFIESRCNRGSTRSSGKRLSLINRLQPIIDNISRLGRSTRSFRANDVKFGMWFSFSSRSCGRYKFAKLIICVPDKSSSCKFIGNRGISLIGFQDRSRVDRCVKFLKKSDEKYGADIFFRSRCFNALKVPNALLCIPSPIGLWDKDRYSRI